MGVSVSGVPDFIRGVFMVGEREELEADHPVIYLSFPRRTFWLGASHGVKHLNQHDEFGTFGSLILSA